MTRRRFIMLLAGGGVAGWPLAAPAQQPAKVPRIGYLRFGSASAGANRVEALRAGLRDLGYVEGKNIVIEFRWADTIEQLHILAAELVRMNVDIIFATSSTEVEPARQATKTIPIVFDAHADPVGVVASLARPGGNITGLSVMLPELVAKQLEILTEAVPHVTRIGVLFTPTAPSHRPALQAVEAAGEKLGVQLHLVPGANRRGFRRGVRDDGAGTCRRFSRRGGSAYYLSASASGRARIKAPVAGDV